MNKIISFLTVCVAMLSLTGSVSAEELKCTTTLIEKPKGRVAGVGMSRSGPFGAPMMPVMLEPRTEFGRKLSTFTVGSPESPEESVENQNVCVSRQDFKKAKFRGSVCLLAVSGKRSPEATVSSLFLNALRGPSRPFQGGSAIEERDSGEVNFPLASDGDYIRWRQILSAGSERGEDLILEVECAR